MHSSFVFSSDNFYKFDEYYFSQYYNLYFYSYSRWLCSSDLVKQDDSIIDLGCGNGMLLVELVILVDKMKTYGLNLLYICSNLLSQLFNMNKIPF